MDRSSAGDYELLGEIPELGIERYEDLDRQFHGHLDVLSVDATPATTARGALSALELAIPMVDDFDGEAAELVRLPRTTYAA